jgi:hypothetical protein
LLEDSSSFEWRKKRKSDQTDLAERLRRLSLGMRSYEFEFELGESGYGALGLIAASLLNG